ncbi:MAG: phosphoglycolate phosphatase [Rhodoferax sp.]
MTAEVWTAAPVRAVLFDLDGTLYDSAPDLGGAADAMRVARGLSSLPMSAYRPVAGAGARGLLGVAFGVTPTDAEYPALQAEFFDRYAQRLTQDSRIFDGVDVLLAWLNAQRLLWGIVTNKSERFAKPLVAAVPAFARCAVLIGGDTTPHSKPHPEPLLAAARWLNLPAQQCIYVGDDLRDIQAARGAGMRAVAAHYGYLGADADPVQWQPDAVIHSPESLTELLQSMQSA